ncbi:hepatic triacylglycerol lipase-like isoform X2 [Notechis scutatus]|uniref:Hepatic triacylglycerol lipase-like isoform X2 n=1 Tax=Notechis scutatus TaxID=8663 RepID=A0A6J1V3K9_9SAUR|nr:hepatic triacylglycerol lipase-like isoform X2 [Notechis scutatus]
MTKKAGKSLKEKVTLKNNLLKEALAELLGTLILVALGCGCVAQAVLSKGTMGGAATISVGFAMAVTLGVYVAGGISGGHINPAVSFAMCLTGKMKWAKLPVYVLAQYLGAFLGSAVVFGINYDALIFYTGGSFTVKGPNATAHIFATYPQEYLSLANGFADQMMSTAFLILGVFAILDTDNLGVPKGLEPIAIGLLIILLTSSMALNSGCAMNPARDLGPRLFTYLAGWGSEVFTAEQGCLIEPHQEGALQQCPFNASLPLVMVIHGWSVDRRLEGWIWKLAEELKIQLPHSNVVITDWLSLAHAHYPVAVQNTRDVGREIARFLEWLEETVQFHRSNAHLVGYSLGAHVAGFAGSSMRGNGKIGRITGLDPAGPLFEGMSPTDRLSPDDADFVDAIHTFTQQHMGLSVGIKQPVAHFDFYPNGGTFQPGCHIMHVYNHIVQYGITGLTQTVKCAHERSVHLFIDSLRYSQKQITGYSCKNMQMFDKGRCLDCRAHRCNTLGYHIRKARVPGSQRFFLKTQPQMPFKVYHYQFKIHFIHEFQEPRIDPTFTISLTGNKDDVENLSITLDAEILEPDVHTWT